MDARNEPHDVGGPLAGGTTGATTRPGLIVPAEVATRFTWDYTQSHAQLTRLYEKGKEAQWNVSTDIDWSPEVVFGQRDDLGLDEQTRTVGQAFLGVSTEGSPFEGLDEDRQALLGWEMQAWIVSQFMHGEQGALVATARLVETVPDIESKFYAANQVNDEARHVEAYARYLNEKLPGHEYPISPPLQALLENIMTESRWDITYLGMQIVVEGLALAAFGMGNLIFNDPIIKQITDLVMRDEARHVAFGVLALRDVIPELSSAELEDRAEFLCEATNLMYQRFLLEQVWERMDIDAERGREWAIHSPVMVMFRQVLFSKIVPNVNKLGLMTPRVRQLFEELQVAQFATFVDPQTEELLAG